MLFAGPGAAAGLGRDARFAALARPPMRVASIGLAGGRFPLAPVLDWLGTTLRSPALESQRSATSAESRAAAEALRGEEPPMAG